MCTEHVCADVGKGLRFVLSVPKYILPFIYPQA